jgi:hypothetical protein
LTSWNFNAEVGFCSDTKQTVVTFVMDIAGRPKFDRTKVERKSGAEECFRFTEEGKAHLKRLLRGQNKKGNP